LFRGTESNLPAPRRSATYSAAVGCAGVKVSYGHVAALLFCAYALQQFIVTARRGVRNVGAPWARRGMGSRFAARVDALHEV